MMRKVFMLLTMLAAGPATAQVNATSGPGGDVRVLDKVTGEITDVTLNRGQQQQVGLINILMNDCRFPTNNPSGDAFAQIVVTYRDEPEPVFSGWMIASAPALNAMDHPRYDVWALRCMTS